MYGSLLFVFLTALFAAHISAGHASPLRELPGDLPPAFVRLLDRDAGDFYSRAAVDAMAGQAGLQRPGLAADLFERAASRGLTSLEKNRTTPSLEEWLAIASIGALYSASAGATDGGHGLASSQDGPGITVRQLAQILVNRVEQAASSRPAAQSRRSGAAGGFSLVSAIMQSRLDTAFVEAAAEVVSPTVTAEGMIAVDFLGLRDFAFVVSPVTNSIQVMDFKTGLTITLNQGDYGEAAQPIRFGAPDLRPPGQAPALAPQMTIQDLLLLVKRFLSTYLLHPFTLGSLLLFGIFWLVLRIGRRAA